MQERDGAVFWRSLEMMLFLDGKLNSILPFAGTSYENDCRTTTERLILLPLRVPTVKMKYHKIDAWAEAAKSQINAVLVGELER